MKYKVTNKLEQPIKLGSLYFKPKESKELEFEPKSDKFIVEKIEKIEKKKTEKEVKQ